MKEEKTRQNKAAHPTADPSNESTHHHAALIASGAGVRTLNAKLHSRMTYARVIQVACRIAVCSMLVFAVLFWSLTPFAQHAIDRTIRFWIIWGLIESVLLGTCIGAFVVALRRK